MAENLTPEGEVVLQEQEPTDDQDAQDEPEAGEFGEDAPEGESEPDERGTKKRPGETEEDLRRRIGQLTARLGKQEETHRTLKDENTNLKRRQEAGPRPKAPDPNRYTDDIGVYDSDRFSNDQTKYEDKLHEWRQSQTPTVTGPPSEQEEPGLDGEYAAASDDFWERTKPLSAKYEDFRESLKNASFTQNVVNAFQKRNAGPEIAYYLSKNEAEAVRIGTLDHDDMLMEIGKLEAKVSGPPAKKVLSGAPPPIKPVKGDAPVSGKSEAEMTDVEWFTWKKQEKLKKLKASP
jgi:hypothetical protein